MDPLTADALRDRPRTDPLARIGRAAMLLSRELAACRREIADLRRENARLRGKLGSHPSGAER